MTTRTRKPRRFAASVEVLAVVVGVPVLLLATVRPSGGLHRPIVPSTQSLHAFVEAPVQVKLTALAHVGVWVVWFLWAYCAAVVALSCVGLIAHHLRFRGPASAVLRIRNRVVPASVRLILDTVFVAAIMAPALRASAAVGHLPGWSAVTQLAPRPDVPAPLPGGALASARADGPAGSTTGEAPTYTVVRGDTLSGIALAECGDASRWPSIAAASPQVTNPNLIHPGDQLTVPCEPAAAPISANTQGPVLHTVVAGESLYSIAEQYASPGTSEAEIGERAMQLFAANRDRAVSPEGDRLERPRFIEAGWTLVVPPSVLAPPRAAVPAPPPAPPGPPAQAPAAPDPAPASIPPVSAPTPALVPEPGGSTRSAPATTPRPTVAPAAADRHAPARPVSAPQGKTHGIRVPGGWLPYGLASGLAGLAYLATLRRWSRRPLDRPERRRPMGPLLGALSGADRVLDAITPHTLALLEVYQAGREGPMPRVLGAWEAGRGVAFLLDAEPDDLPPGGDDRAKTFRVDFGERDGKAVGVTTALTEPKTCLRREVVPFIDELLVPVGRREGEGWFHLPLLNEPLSVVGRAAQQTVWTLLMAAAVRTGRLDLRISVAGDLLGECRLPDGVELPGLEIMPAGELGGLPGSLADEALERARRIKQEGYETFADLQTLWPAWISAWVLVLDPATASACAPQLTELASMGVGAIVLGEWPAARQLVADAGQVGLSAPRLGSVEQLEPVALGQGVVEELEEVTRAPEADEALEAGLGDDPEPADLESVDVCIELTREAAPAARIRLYVLGGFRATRDGEEISMTATSSALARELVARLAVAGADPVPAKVLREELWPDELEPEVNKGQPLYQLVSRARSWLLGGSSTKEEKEGIIEYLKPRTQHEGGSYRLRGVWVDLVAFRQAAGQGSRESIEEALRLYEGELLAGQESERHFRWVSTGDFRDAERFRFYAAAANLAEGLLADGDPDLALTVLDRALSAREGAAIEELARLAMRCEAARGSADGIRRRYGRLCAALERDEASGETAQLRRELLASLDGPAARPRPPTVRKGVPGLHVVGGRSASVAD